MTDTETRRRYTPRQTDAVHFIANNPGATVADIAKAAGASTSGSNAADFLRRMIDAGMVQVVLTPQTVEDFNL